jgi:hypothetical protein
MTDSERRQISRLGGLARARKYGRELTGPATEARRQRFYDATDPSLHPVERRRQAEIAEREHMARLALRSAQKRRKAR